LRMGDGSGMASARGRAKRRKSFVGMVGVMMIVMLEYRVK
jgi:hypothetical protein